MAPTPPCYQYDTVRAVRKVDGWNYFFTSRACALSGQCYLLLMSNAAIEVGSVHQMSGLYGRKAVQVIWVSENTVEFKYVGKTGSAVMTREVFVCKVAR